MLSSGDLLRIRELLGREPSEVERACFENLWSEHCSYRSTRTFLRSLPTQGKDVIVGPGDDAAVVRFSDDLAIVVGMESHNHPSYVDPYHGAATGVGGIVRDVVSMGGRPIALMDPLYFGPLAREKNRYLFEHVVSGIGDYGNCIGVPVVRGEVVFDEGYSGNPLVNVVCIGTVHPGRYLTGHAQKTGSRLVLVGSSTGRDGLGGASFASRDLSEDASEEDRPSVQIGDPYTEKLIIDATLEMAATGHVLSCKDLGAAGLAGASSELCSTFGALIRAERVHLRETGMRPAEIMLSESQERMVLEVPAEHVAEIGRIAEKYNLRWSEIGEVIAERCYRVTFQGETVCDIPINLLTGDAPACRWEMEPYQAEQPFSRPVEAIKDLALRILSHPDVAGKEWVYEQYDHDVQLRTISMGGDAAVLRLQDKALVLSCGCNPRHIYLSPYAGTANAVIENACNLACQGAVPLCLVNCLNFASPIHPNVYWQLEQCTRGMGDMARSLSIPVVGGNVSLYNESDEFGTQIKPTPSIGLIGKGDLRSSLSPSDGNELALIGKNEPFFGGSVLDAISGCGGKAPSVADPSILKVIRSLVGKERVQGVTDISHGGLLAALSRLAPRSSLEFETEMFSALFSEAYGRFLLAFQNESQLRDIPYTILGEVGGDALRIHGPEGDLTLSSSELRNAANSVTRTMRHAWQ
ncbi:MAG: phosphoribosylformylglycinamidine synthase subunit PurL [Methanomicrobiales archaeon]|nr:phosphoribosylformylglycinamidine synthase subunit PurL [Methanomicrobiales archaeon]